MCDCACALQAKKISERAMNAMFQQNIAPDQEWSYDLVKFLELCVGALVRCPSTGYELALDAQARLNKHRFFLEWKQEQAACAPDCNLPMPEEEQELQLPSTPPAAADLLPCEYALQREDNIRRNQARMEGLGLLDQAPRSPTEPPPVGCIPQPEPRQQNLVNSMPFEVTRHGRCT